MSDIIAKKVAVVGPGAWGMALACLASQNSHEVICYGRDSQVVEQINHANLNDKHCHGKVLPLNIRATAACSDLAQSDAFIISLSAQSVRAVLTEMKDVIAQNVSAIIILCSKGVEVSSQKFMTQILEEIAIKNPIAVLSGPNFAKEVLENKKAATTLASTDLHLLKYASGILKTQNFTLEMSSDVIGVQLCGAIKNVYAIGAGAVRGMRLGENFSAAFIQRATLEMRSILRAIGCDQDTIFTYAGLGDLILTCSSMTSRNTQFGAALAAGSEHTLAAKTIEGYHTAAAIMNLLKIHDGTEYILLKTIADVLRGAENVESLAKINLL